MFVLTKTYRHYIYDYRGSWLWASCLSETRIIPWLPQWELKSISPQESAGIIHLLYVLKIPSKKEERERGSERRGKGGREWEGMCAG